MFSLTHSALDCFLVSVCFESIWLGSTCPYSIHYLFLTSLQRTANRMENAAISHRAELITIGIVSAPPPPLSLFTSAFQWCRLQGQRSGGPHRWHWWISGWGDCASPRGMGSQNPHWAAKESPLSWQKVGVLPVLPSAVLFVAQIQKHWVTTSPTHIVVNSSLKRLSHTLLQEVGVFPERTGPDER